MSKDEAYLRLIRAAKRRLWENASLDKAVDDTRVSFRVCELSKRGQKCVADYYVPEVFYICWTMHAGVYADLCVLDILQSKKVSEVYMNGGFKADLQNVRMLGNWPFQRLCVVGKVLSCEQREEDWLLLVDDGSHDDGCVEASIDKYVWAMMEVEGACFGVRAGWCVCVYGTVRRVGTNHGTGVVAMRADRVSVAAKRGGELLRQMEWWQNVLRTRETMRSPWVVDMHSQDAMEALRSLERSKSPVEPEEPEEPVELAEQPRTVPAASRRSVEVVDLDAEEQELRVLVPPPRKTAGGGSGGSPDKSLGVPLAEWAAETLSRPVGVRVATAEQLELAVVRALVREAQGESSVPEVSFEKVYGTYGVTVVLNGLVLGGFVESSVGLMHDELVYSRWKATQFRESKQFLLSCVLEKLVKQGAVAMVDGLSSMGPGATVDVRPLSASLELVRAVLAGHRGPLPVSMKTVRATLWPGAGRAAALAVVGELVARGGLSAGAASGSPAWKFDWAGDCWRR